MNELYTAQLPCIGHTNRIFNLQFSDNNTCNHQFLASASDDNTVAIWRHTDDRFSQVATYCGHSDSVMRVSWAPHDSSLLASGSSDSTVHVWRLADAVATTKRTLGHAGCRHVTTFKGHPEEIYAVEWIQAPGNSSMEVTSRHIAAASGASIFLWDIETQTKQQLDNPQPPAEANGKKDALPERWQEAHIFGIAQQPNGVLLAAACSDSVLRFWQRDGGSGFIPYQAIPWGSAVASDCTFSPDGNLFAATAKDGSLLVMDIRQGLALWNETLPVSLYSCRFHDIAGRQTLVLPASDGAVYLLDIAAGVVDVMQPANYLGLTLHTATVSGDGKFMAAAGERVVLRDDLFEFSAEQSGALVADEEPEEGGKKSTTLRLQDSSEGKVKKWAPIYLWSAS